MEELSRDEGFPNKMTRMTYKNEWSNTCNLNARCRHVWSGIVCVGKLVIQTTNFFPHVLGKCSV